MASSEFEYSFTVFTPTYNRAHTLRRVYDSLLNQTFRDFEWLVVDDGSTDGTADLLKSFQAEGKFPVRVVRQENQGKPAALNRAVKEARGRWFLTLDSDDACRADALARFSEHWNSIPPERRREYSGVTALCSDQHGRVVGDRFPKDVFDSDSLSNRYIHRIQGEKWGFQRTDILREFPFPPIRGLGLSVVWNRIGRRYKTRYVNEVLRTYYMNEEHGSITAEKNRTLANPEGRAYSRLDLLNNDLDFFRYAPIHFIKSFVQYARFSRHSGMGVGSIIARLKGGLRRAILIALMPVSLAIVAFDRLRYGGRSVKQTGRKMAAIAAVLAASLAAAGTAVGGETARICTGVRPTEPPGSFTEEERLRGLAVFRADPLFPEQRWAGAGSDFSVAAARGEFEPLVLGLTAFRPWGEVQIRIGDLRTEDGHVLPAPVIGVRAVRVLTLPVDSRLVSAGEKPCRRQPFVLMPGDRLELGPEEPAWFWLTIAVPRDARPGDYRGTIRLFSGEKEIADFPLTVRVHSFSLEAPPIDYLMLHETSLTEIPEAKTEQDHSKVMKRAEAVYRDLHEHGMTAVSPVEAPDFKRGPGGVPEFPVARAALDLARKSGLTGTPVINIATLARTEKKSLPWNHAEHRPDYHPVLVTEYVESVLGWARAAGWKSVAFSPIDEPDNPERTRIGEEVLKAARKVEGALTFLAGSPKQIAPLSRWVNIADLRASRHTPRDREKLERAGRRVWIYDNWIVLGTTPVETRFVTGLYAWNAGLQGVTAWTYPLTDQRAIDWETGWRPPVIGEDGRPVTTTVWEAFREGVDDGRYAYTLERLIERARSAGLERDSKEAGETLRRVAERIAPAVRWYAGGKKEGRRMGGIGPMEFHRSRDELSGAIEMLSGKLAEYIHNP